MSMYKVKASGMQKGPAAQKSMFPKATGPVVTPKTKSPVPAVTATDPIPRSSEYMEDAKALMAALWAVEGGEADVADRRGELVHPIIMNLRDGHYGKMANGTDPFVRLANEPGCPISAKQIRRIFSRWEFALKVHALGEKHPRLGPALYEATACEKDTKKRLMVLREAEANRLNLAETRTLARKSAGIVEKTNTSDLPLWQKHLRDVASEATKKLSQARKDMREAKGRLDDFDRHILDELFNILDQIRSEASHE